MKRPILVYVALSIFILAVLSAFVFTKYVYARPSCDSASITIATDKDSYMATETVTGTVTVTNNTPKAYLITFISRIFNEGLLLFGRIRTYTVYTGITKYTLADMFGRELKTSVGDEGSYKIDIIASAGECTLRAEDTFTVGPPVAGTILNMEYLATDPPIIPSAKFDVAVFYTEYWSDVDGGSKIGAMLFIPVGEPFNEGWPVKIWTHGLGGPGADFWHWPFVEDDWRRRGYNAGMAFSNHGFVSLTPWLPGAGPSDPFATYSPLSLDRNAQAVFDGFKALSYLESYFASHPELAQQANVNVVVDESRQVMSSNCMSTPSMVYFASKVKEHPEVSNLKAIVSDSFGPGVAYNTHCIIPYALDLEDSLFATGVFGMSLSTIWCLAEDKGWNLSLFFTQKAIDLLQQPVETPVGTLSLMRSATVEPPESCDIAGPIYEAVKLDLGCEPTSREVLEWMVTEEMLRIFEYETIEEIISDPFYRQYFAASDPFFEENIEPFSPEVPLLVVSNGGIDKKNGLPSSYERHFCMTLPKIQTLQSWGWNVNYFFEEGVDSSSMSAGPGHNWVMRELKGILYPVP